MAKQKERKGLNSKVPYQKRLIRRYHLASKFGSPGYYNSTSKENAGKKYPMPLAVLQGREIFIEVDVWVEVE